MYATENLQHSACYQIQNSHEFRNFEHLLGSYLFQYHQVSILLALTLKYTAGCERNLQMFTFHSQANQPTDAKDPNLCF